MVENQLSCHEGKIRVTVFEILVLIIMLLSNQFYDLIFLTGNGGSEIEYFPLFLFFTAFLSYVFISGGRNCFLIIIFFVLNKSLILFISLMDPEYLNWVMSNGDAERLHIPAVLSLDLDNIVFYLTDFENFAVVSGRITHVIYYFFWGILSAVFTFENTFAGVMISSYVANIFLILIGAFVIYNSLNKLGLSRELVAKGVAIFIFSPFLFSWSSMPMKESMVALIVVLLVAQIFRPNRPVFILYTFLFMFERLYIIYLSGIIFLLSRSVSAFYKLLCILFSALFLFSVFPMEKFFMTLLYQIEYQSNVANSDRSLAFDGVVVNLFRAVFSPFPFAAFLIAEYQDFYYRIHYLVQPIYVFMMLKVLFTKTKFSMLIFMILLLNYFLFPYGARQKITVLIPLISFLYPLFLHCRRTGMSMSYFWRI